ncbi:MAG: hypothetical protein KC417_01830, partial [Myxococcales bacterium]|nr:hypothetical protein [Myxococcales bacterium]
MMRGASGSRAWMLAIALGGLAGCTLISAPGDFGAGAVDGSVDAKTKDSFVPPVDSSMPDGGRMRPVLNCNPLDNKGCLGDTCTADAPAGNDACESGNCADIRSLRLTTNAADESSGICASACASDWDCPTGFACWSPGTGARMCVSYMYLQQTNVGSLTTESCTAPTQCASLSCAYGRGVRSCARDTDCDSDTSERCGGFEDYNRNFPVTNDSRNGFSQLACVPSTDAVFAGSMGDRNKALGDSCTNSNECVSRLCIGD